MKHNHISRFPLCECKPAAYHTQLRNGVDNYDIKMYLKNIRAGEEVRYFGRPRTNLNHCLYYFQYKDKPEPLPTLFSIKGQT